jgi:hypothetical protein
MISDFPLRGVCLRASVGIAGGALEHGSGRINNGLAPGALVGVDDGVVRGNHILAAGQKAALKTFSFFTLGFPTQPRP